MPASDRTELSANAIADLPSPLGCEYPTHIVPKPTTSGTVVMYTQGKDSTYEAKQHHLWLLTVFDETQCCICKRKLVAVIAVLDDVIRN